MMRMFLYILQACSELTLEYVQRRVDEIVKDSPLKNTIANPLFGILANKVGMSYNIRFNSSEIKPFYEKEKRKYVKDTSEDPLTSILIKLYPSSAGSLTTSTLSTTNPVKLFNCNEKEGVEFFSGLFLAILNENKDFKFKCNKTPSDTKNTIKNRQKLFDEISNSFLAPSKVSFFQDKMIKLLLIHSYMVTILNPITTPNTQDLFKTYIENVFDGVESSKKPKIVCNDKILSMAIDYNRNFSFFPYSNLKSPSQSMLISAFSRKSGVFDNNQKFSDCAEICLLNLCNCLFFHDEQIHLEHLPNSSAELKDFYETYKTPFSLSQEIRKKWSEVVEDLDPLFDDDSLYPTKNISYVLASSNNELCSGILNMINILTRITGIDSQPYFEKLDEGSVKNSLVNLFQKLKYEKDTFIDVSFISKTFKEESMKNGKKDLFGMFTVNFEFSSGDSARILVSQNKGHAELSLVSTRPAKSFELDFKKIEECTKDSNLLNEICKNILILETEQEKNFKRSKIFTELYCSGSLMKNSDRFNCLKNLNKAIDLTAKNCSSLELTPLNRVHLDYKKELENIFNIVLNNVEFISENTAIMFSEFLIFKPEILKDRCNLILFGWTKSQETKSRFLKEKWNEYLENELPNFTDTSEILDSQRSRRNEKVSFLKENLEKFKNLKILTLKDLYFEGKDLTEIILKAKNLEKLEKFSIFYVPLSILPNEIGELENLKNLEIIFTSLEELPESLKNLKKLERLDLSYNKLRSLPIEMESVIKKLKWLNLRDNEEFQFKPKDGSIGSKKIFQLVKRKNLKIDTKRKYFGCF